MAALRVSGAMVRARAIPVAVLLVGTVVAGCTRVVFVEGSNTSADAITSTTWATEDRWTITKLWADDTLRLIEARAGRTYNETPIKIATWAEARCRELASGRTTEVVQQHFRESLFRDYGSWVGLSESETWVVFGREVFSSLTEEICPMYSG
ncbi:hypothetical protein ACFLQ7_00605 [Actinomycetota bacterium]